MILLSGCTYMYVGMHEHITYVCVEIWMRDMGERNGMCCMTNFKVIDDKREFKFACHEYITGKSFE